MGREVRGREEEGCKKEKGKLEMDTGTGSKRMSRRRKLDKKTEKKNEQVEDDCKKKARIKEMGGRREDDVERAEKTEGEDEQEGKRISGRKRRRGDYKKM